MFRIRDLLILLSELNLEQAKVFPTRDPMHRHHLIPLWEPNLELPREFLTSDPILQQELNWPLVRELLIRIRGSLTLQLELNWLRDKCLASTTDVLQIDPTTRA